MQSLLLLAGAASPDAALWGSSWGAVLAPLNGECRPLCLENGTAFEWCHRDVLRLYDPGGGRAHVIGRFDPQSSPRPLVHVFAGGDTCGGGESSATVTFKCCPPKPASEPAVDRSVGGLEKMFRDAVVSWAGDSGQDELAVAAAAAARAIAEMHGRNGSVPGSARFCSPPRPTSPTAAATDLASATQTRPCHWEVSVCSPVACEGLRRPSRRPHSPSEDELRALRDEVRDMFRRSYDSYVDLAYPHGELRAVSCDGHTFSQSAVPALTLIDSLDTLAVMGNGSEFRRAVGLVLDAVPDFNIDTEVSVFETTIRVLGGLLSGHVVSTNAVRLGLADRTWNYDGGLLELAQDLGQRLLEAFPTPDALHTGIPFGTVNLASGVPAGETPVASTAGAGSLTLEFGVLSALTGDTRFVTAARNAVRALHALRSPVTGLVGKHVDGQAGKWTETTSGIGTNADSFYEYLLKSDMLFGDDNAWLLFAEQYESVLAFQLRGDWYADVDMGSGAVLREHLEGLQTFWPGMQTLIGDIGGATHSLNAMMGVWVEEGLMPEQYGYRTRELGSTALQRQYILRPELIESLMYVRRATGDNSWLWAGRDVLLALQRHTRTRCAYAGVDDMATGELRDSMPSFFVGETLKYLYLLFEDALAPAGHWVLRNDAPFGGWVFSTEAHIFPIAQFRRRRPWGAGRNTAAHRPAALRVCPADAADTGGWVASYDPSYQPDDGGTASVGAGNSNAEMQRLLQSMTQFKFGL